MAIRGICPGETQVLGAVELATRPSKAQPWSFSLRSTVFKLRKRRLLEEYKAGALN